MAIRTKSGVKLTSFKLRAGAMKQLRTSPEAENLLDRIAATIANNAGRNAAGHTPSGGLDMSQAEFAVDGGTSGGKRGRYRSSVRTSNFESVFAEYNYASLTAALDDVARRLGRT